MVSKQVMRLIRFGAAITLLLLALSFGVSSRPAYADPTAAASSSIGVQVDQPTTTLPPVTTTTTTPAPTTTVTSPPATTTIPVTTTVPVTIPDTLPDVLPPPVAVNSNDDSKGFVSQVKSAARTSKDLAKGILSGKPVADVAQAVLPASVATVVVPAVRTASTFVFPIGLAAAVIAFLVLQQRVDAGDPKLTAAPMAHDDDVVEFS